MDIDSCPAGSTPAGRHDKSEVMVLNAERPACVCLFATGRGGNPLRHLPLLEALARQNCTVIAPHFELVASSIPGKADLTARIETAGQALDRCAPSGLPIAGVGHSIGTVALLVLAGAEARTLAGERITARPTWNFTRLALFAPPADFFRSSGALAPVTAPVHIWSGGRDAITPPEQSDFLKKTLQHHTPVTVSRIEDAGHFTFMHELPPHVTDTHPDRQSFLPAFTAEVCAFVTARSEPGRDHQRPAN